ncbi:PilZ domain-containing protein [Desulfogranum mediterraneum]|uniref:PilZ domain-containing protein n=1 Tax=Desulfogranum mediterraneum TaxID=160661 RepID=UPI00040446F0|nr:PilZ domain-containing protein [Desulfogranum mediterraneum]
MFGRSRSYDVKGGRIRVVCARCKAIRYVSVSSSSRRKTVRCKCGKSGVYTLNYRGAPRESIRGRAQVIMGQQRQISVQLNDISPGGIGFRTRGNARMFKLNQELNIKYRSSTGIMSQRKIRIQNIAIDRVGARFIDGLGRFNQSVL